MEFGFRETAPNRIQRGDVIGVGVRDEEVLERKFVPLQQVKNRLCLETGIEQGRLARDFIPNQVTVHFEARAGGCDLAQLSPEAEVALLRQPAVSNPFEPCRVQSEFPCQTLEIRTPRKSACFLES